ncbi:phosphoribosylformylglycinamidine synthase subunit PurL [Haloquadratum walsbyi]|jgi:phosphoribosylformylglycinamidine synthase subunit II (EC 6.3.5.3)|uniref:Phosphoribosylformylglycinamidine synthase subunit PurL n=1 Tax=Haloquadratum walsbyi J07HQW2 TaxID=1238425 RepID=U1PSE8_9EURY|nr:phosphoribosylformylglycinamidine synthase subunit PurL [Haloquadratum walsbyi]ERG96727.1 MAG: phosphoribosylformylglycinamidine synthase II [Haloquadratum walsbyi J07HQW2]
MVLSDSDRDIITTELGRELTPAEAVLFENLWSEHCAYRSSRPLLQSFTTGDDSSDDEIADNVVIGPGDDAAVVRLPSVDEASETPTYITMGIESHNHPSYVDPYDGAATGVGGIVRDTLSMGAYPIALADSLYFGSFDDERTQYLLDGVVEGIADYGNAIGVPTVAGSAEFHDDYTGNPLVNVACIGLVTDERLVTAEAQSPDNKLVLVGNATGRDGLGGASFASEDLSEDAETEDRPAVQVGDPYTEKRLIEANEEFITADLIQSARDLGAAGLGGASSELVAKGGLGARIDLERVHQREPEMNAMEILLAESQERMCYEVHPDDVDAVGDIATKYDLGHAVIGEIHDGNYVCTFDDEIVVDVPATLLADGAPMNDLSVTTPSIPERSDPPEIDPETAFNTVVSAPNTASKHWIYRQYDHEVGLRTAMRPGDDAAIIDVREAGVGLALSSGAVPAWTACDPYQGARAVALENATNIAVKGATPLAAVDCLNGGNPEKTDVYGGFKDIVEGLADMCHTLSVPVVGGNVSLYNDSVSGPIPPTPTLALVGTTPTLNAPPAALTGDETLLLVGHQSNNLGGSELLAQTDETDPFPVLPSNPATVIDALTRVANHQSTLATHDVSTGGLAVTLAELITPDAGARVTVPNKASLFTETPGRAVIETTDPDAVREIFEDVAPVISLGDTTTDGILTIDIDQESTVSESPAVTTDAATVVEQRRTLQNTLE